MDTAEQGSVLAALEGQERQLRQQEKVIEQMHRAVAEASQCSEVACETVTAQLTYVIGQLQAMGPATLSSQSAEPPAPASSPAPASEVRPVRLSSLERFSGESNDCRPFLCQCELHFEFQPATFPSDRDKIAFIISYIHLPPGAAHLPLRFRSLWRLDVPASPLPNVTVG